MSDEAPAWAASPPVWATAPEGEAPSWAKGEGNVRTASPANARTQPPTATDTLGAFTKATLSEAASLGDMVYNVFPGLIGVGAGLATGAKSIAEGDSRARVSQRVGDAMSAPIEALGSPLHKLMQLAGYGEEEVGRSAADTIMDKAMGLLSKGGKWFEENTGGFLTQQEVENLTNTALTAAGGRGLAHGLEKITPMEMRLEGVRLSPEALRRVQVGELQKAEPKEAAETLEKQGGEAEKAGQALSRLRSQIVPDWAKGEGEAKPTLVRAQEKVAAGQTFDMTAEERIAYKGWKDSPEATEETGAPGAVVPPSGPTLVRVPRGQLGAVDVSAFKGTDREGKGLSLEEFTKLSSTLSLGSLIARSDYTLKTLDRLPQGRMEFTREMVEQQLKRDDVTDVERGAIGAALEGVPKGGKLSAKDLMVGVKKATGDFELKAKETDQYADYGLEGVGRVSESMRDDMGLNDHWIPEDATLEEQTRLRQEHYDEAAKKAGEVTPTTTLYRLPKGVSVSSSNHFGDPQLFGWTRSFEEGGVRHVVEIQSDLAQHAKGLSEDARADIEGLLRRAREEETDARAHRDAEKAVMDKVTGEGVARGEARYGYNNAQNLFRSAQLHVAELEAKLQEAGATDRIAPILKNWPKRLVREELAKAAEKGEKVARFATADTVAKVEGWPRRGENTTGWENTGPRGPAVDSATEFSPQHQSIYDRYRRDIEKFLRQQGGKDVTDSQGHTWIEVPVPKKGPTQMFGGADPKLLARLAAMGLGAWAAYQYSDENKLLRAFYGAGIGAILANARPISAGKLVLRALSHKEAEGGVRYSIADPAAMRKEDMAKFSLDAVILEREIEKFVPKLAEQEKVTLAIDSGKVDELPEGPVKEAAKAAREAFSAAALRGVDSGVLKDAIENYVTHIVKPKDVVEASRVKDFVRSYSEAVSPNTPFSKARKFPSIAELEARGFTVEKSITVLIGKYMTSLNNAVANKKFLGLLKEETVPYASEIGPVQPRRLVMSEGKAPGNYQLVDHPQFRGLRVHPDIKGQLEMIFDTHEPTSWIRAAEGISSIQKRMGVSLSEFHMKSLIEAAWRAMNLRPDKVARALPSIFRGTHSFFAELEKGSGSEVVREFLHDGNELRAKGPSSEDAGNHFMDAMKWTQDLMNKTLPSSGAPIAAVIVAQKWIDKILWDRLHVGLRYLLWSMKKQTLMENGAPKEEAGKAAAQFAANTEGGQNYQQMVLEAKSRLGRNLGEQIFNPAGRRGIQIGFFAPDWNISWIKSIVDAMGPGSGVKGIWTPKTLADLQRQMMLSSAFYYFVVYNTLNLAFSQHNIWENEDWTQIDMDHDGPRGTAKRHLQIDKGMVEPLKAIRQPGQEFMNKLGYLPKEAANQLMGTEYLGPKANPRSGRIEMIPMKGDYGSFADRAGARAEHAIEGFLPFGVKDNPTEGPIEELLTRTGIIQISGSNARMKAKWKAEEDKRKKALAKKRKEK